MSKNAESRLPNFSKNRSTQGQVDSGFGLSFLAGRQSTVKIKLEIQRALRCRSRRSGYRPTIGFRLGSASADNPLDFGFRDPGGVIRARFLPTNLDDPAPHRIMHAATRTSEPSNTLAQWPPRKQPAPQSKKGVGRRRNTQGTPAVTTGTHLSVPGSPAESPMPRSAAGCGHRFFI